MLIIAYIAGVLLILGIAISTYQDEKKFTLADLIDVVVYSAFSWITIIFLLTQKLTDWMRCYKHDKTIWKKHHN